ncbi:MAG: glycoside-pentoside-hexuronide (GPH):cation symporter [Clostridiales bacterium]|nr:glycoside-pentoside-hexuronide (GPH):cation symporter [Clostridiales bacterium]
MAVSLREKLSYGVAGMGGDLSYGMTNAFFSNYLTDNLKIKPAFLSVMYLVARIWDAINDPMMGTLVDNTRSRWGRFRPWILTGGVLNSIVIILMFTNPGLKVGGVGVYIYATVAYIFWGMSYTIYDIPYWSFVPALATDPKERNVIASVPRFFCGLGQAIVSLFTVSMVEKLGGGNEALGYRRWAMILALVYVATVIITVTGTKERHVPEKKESFTLKKAFVTIKSNDQLLYFMLTAICFNTGWYLTNGLGIYYFKRVLERPGLYSVFAGIVGIGQMVGLISFSVLSNKFTKRRVIKAMMLLTAFGYAIMFLVRNYRGAYVGKLPFLNEDVDVGFIIFAVVAFIACMGIGAIFVSETVMLADVVDYSEYKLGYRTDSIVFSMKSFLLKIAYSIQGLIMGIGLRIGKYNQVDITSQPESAKTAICVMAFAIPVILILISFTVFVKKYKLHGEFYDTVMKSIAKPDDEKENADTAASAE